MPPKTTCPHLIVLLLLVLAAIPAQARVPPGWITVSSSPPGAGVCADGRNCTTTSATFAVTGNAWHTVVVTEQGYQQWSDTVYVIPDQTTTVTAALDLNTATSPAQAPPGLLPVAGAIALCMAIVWRHRPE